MISRDIEKLFNFILVCSCFEALIKYFMILKKIVKLKRQGFT